MGVVEDPFEESVCAEADVEGHKKSARPETFEEFSALASIPLVPRNAALTVSGAVTARLHGFDLDERPLLSGLPSLSGEIVPARTTVNLLRSHLGSTAVVLCERGDPRRPIIVGVLQEAPLSAANVPDSLPRVTVDRDDERVLLTAEREIVLRCGEASITLTRAGKVLIKGKYVLSRSSGYNKIKGAAVDIN